MVLLFVSLVLRVLTRISSAVIFVCSLSSLFLVKVTKQNLKYLTLHQVEDMSNQGILSLDKDSACSEDDFEPIANNLPSSSQGSEKPSDEVSDEDNERYRETANRTGRDGTYWNVDPPSPRRTTRYIILRERPAQNVLW